LALAGMMIAYYFTKRFMHLNVSRETDQHHTAIPNEETWKMKVGSINTAQKKESAALNKLARQRKGPAIVAEDLDGMGDAWLGLLEEEDTLFNMQDWEEGKGKRIR
jgi:hypothetical protein